MIKKFTTLVLAGCICLSGGYCGVMTNNSVQAVTVSANNSEVLNGGDYQDIHWSVNADNQLLIVPKSEVKTAEICDFYTMLENPDPLAQEHYMEIVEFQPWREYNNMINSVIIGDGITSIGAYAFHDMSKLSSVIMSESVTRIGKKSFYALPVTSIKWSSNLLNIGESAFQGTHLKEIILPNGMKIIGDSAFKNCTKLEQTVIPDSITKIGSYAFSGCSALTELSLPDSLVSLSKGAFSKCSSIKSIAFGNGIKEIPWLCFSECTSLESVVIADNISAIGTSAFSDCSSLSYVKISDSVTELKDGAFSKCTKLQKMTVLNPTLDLSTLDSVGNNNYTIYGIANSTAQKYAEAHGISFEIVEVPDKGDVNGDGEFNVADVVLFQKWLLAVPDIELKYWQAADMYKDGRLDVFDLCMMKRKLVNSVAVESVPFNILQKEWVYLPNEV